MATNKSMIQSKYDKVHCKSYGLKLNLETDADIIKKLSSVESVQGYIKQAIRADIARNESVPKNTISVPFSDSAVEMLTEKAAISGKTVPELIALVVNEYLIRTYSVPDSEK